MRQLLKYTIIQKFGFKEINHSFSKDALHLSKVTAKTFTVLQKIFTLKNIKRHDCFQH